MAITLVPSAITGQTLSAAMWNTQVRDNLNGYFVFTTAGDMIYATGASALARLGLVVGGLMYGGASAPAWLAPPLVDSFVKNTIAGVPSYQAISQIAGLLHTNGSAFTNTMRTTTSTSYASMSPVFKVDLTLAVQCTILAFAFGIGKKNSGSYDGNFILSINGTNDVNDNTRVKSTAITPFITMFKLAGVAAGTRTVELKFKTGSAGDETIMDSCQIYAFAFVE